MSNRPLGPSWQASQDRYLAARAHLDGADHLALEMERKWGVGRLRLLVDPELRLKFDRQRVLLNEALASGEVDDVVREATRMANAWRAMDRAAEAVGAEIASGEVWETALPNGGVLALWNGNGRCPGADGRRVEVWTLAEIANIVAAFPEIAKCKQVFPGARVEAVRRVEDPLEGWETTQTDWNDEVGF